MGLDEMSCTLVSFMPLLMNLISLRLGAVRLDSTLSTNVKNRTEQKQIYIDFEIQTHCDNMGRVATKPVFGVSDS